jgi:hypothetical protein
LPSNIFSKISVCKVSVKFRHDLSVIGDMQMNNSLTSYSYS